MTPTHFLTGFSAKRAGDLLKQGRYEAEGDHGIFGEDGVGRLENLVVDEVSTDFLDGDEGVVTIEERQPFLTLLFVLFRVRVTLENFLRQVTVFQVHHVRIMLKERKKHESGYV